MPVQIFVLLQIVSTANCISSNDLVFDYTQVFFWSKLIACAAFGCCIRTVFPLLTVLAATAAQEVQFVHLLP